MGLLDALGGGQPQARMSPITMALLGLLAYGAVKRSGGLGNIFGGGGGAQGTAGEGAEESPGLPGILGSLGGLFSGKQNGGALSTGLQDVLDRFKQSGYGDKAQSWVSSGPNEPIAPHQVGEALGEDRTQWLMQQTGMSRDQLLSGLSAKLPEFMNKLTPNGRVPTEQEASQLIH